MKKLASQRRIPSRTLHLRGAGPTALPEALLVALRWAGAWALVGSALGVLVMLGKALPFAESSGRPDNAFSSAFWVPTLTLGAAAGGLGVGLLFAGLMALSSEWRESLEETPGILARLGPDIACGAAAGLIAGLLVGGLTGALFFAAVGAATAAIMKWHSP